MVHAVQQLVSKYRALFIGALLAVTTSLALAPSQADAAVTVPIDTPKFAGAFTIQNFTTTLVNGVPTLAAVGTLTGNAKNAMATNVAIGNVTIPAAVTTPSCPVLHLDLGPLTLNVLGLQIDLSEVVLDITAIPGNGNLLGNLLCAVAGLLDPGSLNQLVALLNQILNLLG